MYKLYKSPSNTQFAFRIDSATSIPFDPANTDYAKFKSDLAAGVELQDANGVAMSAADIQTFLAGLK